MLKCLDIWKIFWASVVWSPILIVCVKMLTNSQYQGSKPSKADHGRGAQNAFARPKTQEPQILLFFTLLFLWGMKIFSPYKIAVTGPQEFCLNSKNPKIFSPYKIAVTRLQEFCLNLA